MKAKSNGHRVYAGKAAELSGGFVRQVKFGTKTILVTRVGGTIVAYNGQCRHMKAPLATLEDGKAIPSFAPGTAGVTTWQQERPWANRRYACLRTFVELTVDGEVWVILDGGDGQDFH